MWILWTYLAAVALVYLVGVPVAYAVFRRRRGWRPQISLLFALAWPLAPFVLRLTRPLR